MLTLSSARVQFGWFAALLLAPRHLRFRLVGPVATLSSFLLVVSASADPLVITSGILGFTQDNFVEVDISGPDFAVRFADSPEATAFRTLL
jgi:hypothetical protein